MPGRLLAVLAVAGAALAGCGNEPGFSGQAPPGEIAFSFGGRIHVMAPDGSGLTRLTGGTFAAENPEDFLPTWSPDGRTLAFVRQTERRDETRLRIHLLDRYGGPPRRLATPGDVLWPAWSPDGRRIAFVRFTEGNDVYTTALVVADTDGGNERVLRRARADEDPILFLGEPAWSPDGTRIAYTRTVLDRRSVFRPSLYVIGAGGGRPRLLARGGDTAAWSPDGGRIAFASIRDRNGKDCYETCAYSPELYVMKADGSEPVRLTRNRGSDGSPSWSSDGRRIAFASDRNYPSAERSEIYSIGADGSCLTWLTNGSPESAYPSWRPGSADSAPGACGATRRPPVVEVDLGRIRAPQDAPVYWLGERFGNMLLGSADGAFVYDDCARYRPRDCGPSVQIGQESVCTGGSRATALGWRVSASRGLLFIDAGRDGLRLITGPAQVNVFGDRRRTLAALRALRRIGRPAAPLPPPALPRDILALLRRTERTYRRQRSVEGAARALGQRPGLVRRRLEFARAVKALPRVRAIGCSRR